MKRTITYSAVVAFSLSLCSLGLSGCGDAADTESATEPAPSTSADDGSMDKDAEGSGDNDAHDSDEHADHDEDGS